MRRLVFVCLFVLTSMVAWAPGIAAQSNDLPDAPQAKSDGLEFSIEGAIIDDTFGSPLNWGANEDGRLFLLVTIDVRNTNSDSRNMNSNNFRIRNGSEFIPADDGLSKRPDELNIPAMGDALGDTLDGKESKLYILGWRLEPEIDEYILDIDYGSAKTIDLQPWLDLDIRPGDLRATQPRASASSRASSRASARASSRASSRPTATEVANDDEITDDEQDYLDAIRDDSLRLYGALDQASTLFTNAGNDPTLILDADWQLDTATQLAVWKSVYNNAQELQPSNRQQPIQDKWLEITRLVSGAGDDIALGIDTIDATLLDSGSSKLNQATLLIPDLQQLIEDFTDDPASFEGSTSTSNGSSSGGQLVADCSPFADYDAAQDYYADHPDAQPVIDPDFDGQACEVYFGRG